MALKEKCPAEGPDSTTGGTELKPDSSATTTTTEPKPDSSATNKAPESKPVVSPKQPVVLLHNQSFLLHNQSFLLQIQAQANLLLQQQRLSQERLIQQPLQSPHHNQTLLLPIKPPNQNQSFLLHNQSFLLQVQTQSFLLFNSSVSDRSDEYKPAALRQRIG